MAEVCRPRSYVSIRAVPLEPRQSNSYNIAFAPSKDSDQLAHPHSLISLRRTLWVANDSKCLQANSEYPDHRAQMRKLI